MGVFVNILLWLHLLGLAMGVGGGIALAFTGPKLIAAPPDQLDLMWAFEGFFSRIGSAGLAVLLITGPLMVWLKFGGPSGFTWWFWAKMVLVVAAVVGVGLHQWAGARFHRGDKSAVPMMFIGGRVAGASMVLAMLCAVFAFN